MPVYIQEGLPPPQENGVDSKKRKRSSGIVSDDDETKFQKDDARRALPPLAPQDGVPEQIQFPPLQSKFIHDTMNDIREREAADSRLRRRDRAVAAAMDKAKKRRLSNNDGGDNNWTGIFLDRLSARPDVAQIVASSGGLVTYCEFLSILSMLCCCILRVHYINVRRSFLPIFFHS